MFNGLKKGFSTSTSIYNYVLERQFLNYEMRGRLRSSYKVPYNGRFGGLTSSAAHFRG